MMSSERSSNPSTRLLNTENTAPTTCSVPGRLVSPCIMLLMGLMYMDRCPAEKGIPVYFIVGGLLSIVSVAMATVSSCVYVGEDVPTVLKFMTHTIYAFNTIWFVVGSVWTYTAFKPEYFNEKADKYCSIYLYIFSFTFFTVTYVFTGLVILAIIYKMIFPGNLT